MVSQITVPESILEEIIADGKREAEKGREATGALLGTYDPETDLISVSERHTLPSKIGDGTRKGWLYDKFKYIFGDSRFVRFALQRDHHRQSTQRIGKTPGIVPYHTHSNGSSWSPNDLNARSELHGYVTAKLLYIAGQNKFEAVNANGDSIPVLKNP